MVKTTFLTYHASHLINVINPDMSQDLRSKSEDSEAIKPPPRTDFFTRDVVNQAIAAVPTLGIAQVAEYLSSMKVPPEVAIRALCKNRKRQG